MRRTPSVIFLRKCHLPLRKEASVRQAFLRSREVLQNLTMPYNVKKLTVWLQAKD